MLAGRFRILDLGRVRVLMERPWTGLAIPGWIDREGRWFPWVIHRFHALLDRYFGAERPLRILGLGMGVGMIAHLDPRWRVDFVEKDEEMVRVAREHFWLPEETKVYVEDARDFLRRPSMNRYDVIFHDLFDGKRMVKVLLETRWFEAVETYLAEGGLFVLDVGDLPGEAPHYGKGFARFDVETCRNFWPCNSVPQNALLWAEKRAMPSYASAPSLRSRSLRTAGEASTQWSVA